MTGASFDGALNASSFQVGGALLMGSLAQNTTSFKDVNLSGATINQEVRMTGARFDGTLSTFSIEVGGDLSMQSDADNRTTFNDVNLTGNRFIWARGCAKLNWHFSRSSISLVPPDCGDVLSRTQAVPTHQITGARSRK
jgi:hypothetical protein